MQPMSLPESKVLPLAAPISSLLGVGGERTKLLARLGIFTVEDLLLHPPRRHEDRRKFLAIRDLKLGEAATVLDLYAGVGTFSFLCAKGVPRITLVEESPFGVAAARMNRQEKQPPNMEIIASRVEEAFPLLWKTQTGDCQRPVILLDPPRLGCGRNLIETISSRVKAAGLVYISCDLARLSRDLKMILSGGYYQVREVAPFDMFPKTKHIETAVLLVPKGSPF